MKTEPNRQLVRLLELQRRIVKAYDTAVSIRLKWRIWAEVVTIDMKIRSILFGKEG